MSNITTRPPHYIGPDGRLDDCLVSNGCKIYGTARHSILSTDVIIEERAVVEDSVLLRVRTLRAARTSAALFWAGTPRSKRA